MCTVGPGVRKAPWLWKGEFVAALWRSDDPDDEWQYLWAPITPLPARVFRPRTLSWWALIGYILGVEFSSVWFALSTLSCCGPPDSSPCLLCTCVRRLHLHLISYRDRKNALPLPIVVHSPVDGEHGPVRGGCSFFPTHIFSLPSVTEMMSCKAGIC